MAVDHGNGATPVQTVPSPFGAVPVSFAMFIFKGLPGAIIFSLIVLLYQVVPLLQAIDSKLAVISQNTSFLVREQLDGPRLSQ